MSDHFESDIALQDVLLKSESLNQLRVKVHWR